MVPIGVNECHVGDGFKLKGDGSGSSRDSNSLSINQQPNPRDQTTLVAIKSAYVQPIGEKEGHVALVKSSSYRLEWLSFFLLGTINNLSYVIVNSAAKSMADSFNQGDLIGAVVWSNVAFGIGCRFLNTFYLLQTSYTKRVLACVVLMILGCLGVAFGTLIDFWFILFAVVLIGCFSSLGESVLLGYLKDFNPVLMGAWSSGTGMAGVGGTALYLLFYSVLGFSNRAIFFFQTPVILIFWFAFRYVNRKMATGSDGLSSPSICLRVFHRPSRSSFSEEDSNVSEPSLAEKYKDFEPIGNHSSPTTDLSVQQSASLTLLDHEDSPVYNEHGSSSKSPPKSSHIDSKSSSYQTAPTKHSTSPPVVEKPESASGSTSRPSTKPHRFSGYVPVSESIVEEEVVEEEVPVTEESLATLEFYARESKRDRFWRVLRVIKSPALQLAAVYFFEYMVSVGFASKANPHPDPSDWWCVNAYEVLAFAYQFGVLIARSSVSIIQIKRIEYLTMLQGAHFVLWFIHAMHPFLPLWLQLTDMVFVGLLGGAMYVNVFYLLVESQILRQLDQELGINLTAIGINLGIVASSVVEILLFTTIPQLQGD